MRSTSLFAVLLVAVALAALIIAGRREEPATAVPRGTVTLLGDSLNVGMERYLSDALPGWKIVANDSVGRSTPEGIAELEAGRPGLSSHLVVSLGTNDPPTSVGRFRADVERLLELVGPNRCIVWATIWREGAPNDPFNGILRGAAAANARVRLVEWAEMVEKHPDWLAGDGLHGNEEGYRERAIAVAEATTGCAPAQAVAER
jgi:lysophospholipase L1-like esterase